MSHVLARANALQTQGQLAEALQLLFDAVGGDANAMPERDALVSLLATVVLHTVNARARGVLVRLCEDDSIDVQSIALAILGVIATMPAFARLVELTEAPEDPELEEVEPAAEALCMDPLVQAFLVRAFISEPRAERVMRLVRRALLARLSSGDVGASWHWTAAALIAGTAWHGEYVWEESADEQAFVEAAAEHLEAWLHSMTAPGERTASAEELTAAHASPPSALLLLYGMYRHASKLPSWRALAAVAPAAWEPALAPACRSLVARHVEERLEEQACAVRLPSFGPSADDASRRVRAQYEYHPYPRWTTCPASAQTTVASFITTITGRQKRPDSTRILIAGCGTGRQAVHTARSFPDAEVLAFDLSLASLGHAVRRTQAIGVSSIRYLQGDLLAFAPRALPDPVPDFAIISCSGVLHHLADPRVGWRRLVDSLHPLGVMKIGLYSTHARAGVAAARELLAPLQLGDDDEAVRQARRALLALPADHPARSVLTAQDFYSMGGCRDLVMHVQERSYTIPEIAEELAVLGLRFLGFQVPDAVAAHFRRRFPAASAVRDLESWDRYEREHPLTFRGMYQFWCERVGASQG